MKYTINLFYNTGYDKDNIPDSITTLSSSAERVETITNPAFLRQDAIIASLRIKKSFEEACGIDYVSIGAHPGNYNPKFYCVSNIEMLGNNTTQLELLIDPINSSGGYQNINFLSGFLERCHSSSEEENDNTEANMQLLSGPEPFVPNNELVIVKKRAFVDSSEKFTIIPSYIDLDNLRNTAETYTAAATGETVTVPSLPTNRDATEFSIIYGNNEYKFKVDGLCMYQYNSDIVDKIRIARSLGLDNLILNPYTITWPSVFTKSETSINKFLTIKSNADFEEVFEPYEYEGGLQKFKKSRFHFSTFNILSTSTGEVSTHPRIEVYDYENGNIPIVSYADYSPGGKAYLQPRKNFLSTNGIFEKNVSSTQWNSPGMVMDIPSGQLNSIISNNLAVESNSIQARLGQAGIDISREESYKNFMMGTIGSTYQMGAGMLTGDISSALTGTTGIYEAGFNRYFDMQKQNLAEEELKANTEITALNLKLAGAQIRMGGNIFSSPSFNNMMYTGPRFVMYEKNLTPRDYVRLEEFFTMYGYCMNIRARGEESRFSNRSYCNFIKGENIKIKFNNDTIGGYSIPLYLQKSIEDRLNSGVRIWHRPIHDFVGNNLPN